MGEPAKVGSRRFAVVDRGVRDGNRSLRIDHPQSTLRCDLSIADNVSNVKTLAQTLRKGIRIGDEFGVHRGREVDEETSRL
jgi:hypothetical protein